MNRRERRASDSINRKVEVVEVDEAARERMRRGFTSPEYLKSVQALAEAAQQWRRAHPDARPEFLEDNLRGMTIIANLDSAEALDLVAGNDAARALLAFMDAETGRRGTMQQALFALGYLGLVRR